MTSLNSPLSALSVMVALASGVALHAAAPIDPNPVVASGQVGFSGLESSHAVITQESLQAIVDYNHFNVLPGGSVQFIQPGAEAAILNRILGADPSSIDGTLTANGQVYFVNPAGVTFGEGSVIRADTFLAAAGQITNEDFLAGNLEFSLSGTVANFGTIETAGLAGLLGRQVLNAGEIVSRHGVAVLSSGEKVYLQPVGSSLVVEMAKGAGATADGIELENTGLVSGDEVLFSAGDAFAVALSHSGSVVAKQSARLYSDGGVIEVAGAVSVPGGRVEIGGTDHGGTGAPRAVETSITETASIDVSAEAADQRGHVVVWADELTTFLGSIRGEGIEGGDGAFVEISAAHVEMGEGVWDIALGQGGELLFDPLNVTIDATAATNIVTQMSSGTSVTIDTDAGPWGDPGGTDAGDITIASPIQVTNATNRASLTLHAARDILLNAHVLSNQPVIGGTVFSFNAGRDIRIAPDIFLTAAIQSNATTELNAPFGAVSVGAGAAIDSGRGSLQINALTGVTLGNGVQVLSGSNQSQSSVLQINVPDGTMHFAGGIIRTYGARDVKIVANRLINDTGADAIVQAGSTGNWQIVLPHPYGETFETNEHTYGGLVSGNHAVFNSTGTADPVRNEYHYHYQPMIRVQAHDSTKTYGDDSFLGSHTLWDIDFVNAAAYEGVFSQDTRANNISGNVTRTSAGAASTAGVGTYDIVPSGLVSANGYGFDYSNGTLTVNPRPVTVTASQQNKAYGDVLSLDNTAFTVLDRDGTGLLPNDEQIDTLTLGSQTGIDASTTANVGTYSDEIRATAAAGSAGFDDANYTITFVDGDLVVDRRPVTLAALQQEKIYGNTLTLDNTAFAVLDKDGDATLPNAESIDTVTIASAGGLDASTTANAGTHSDDLVISGESGSNGFDADNYAFTYVDGDLLVNRRPITLTADDRARIYGDSLALGSTAFSIEDWDGDSALPNSETIPSVTLDSQNGYATKTDQNAGTYNDEIRITGQTGGNGFADANYDITYAHGDLTVELRLITVTADQRNKHYGDTLDLGGTAFTVTDHGGGSALPHDELIDTVTLTSRTSIDGSTTADAGTYTDEIRPSAAVGSAGFNNDNYYITFVDGDLVVDPRPVTLTALQQEKVYGNGLTLDGTGFSVLDKDLDAALPNGEQIDTVALESITGVDASTTTDAGTYTDEIEITGQAGSAGFDADNYDFTYMAGPLVVNPRAITLEASQQNKDYGDTLTLDGTAFTITDLDGGGSLPNGEQVDTVTLNSQTGVDASTDANVGTYTDEIAITDQSGSGGFDASNYDITYTDGDLVVDPRAITVTATQQNKAYGDVLSLDNTAFTVLDRDGTGLLPNGEQIDTVTLGSQTGIDASTTANVGTYSDEIQATAVAGSAGFDDGNYTITFVDGDLVVDRRAVTLTALQQEKIYGNSLTLDNTAFAVLDKDGGATLPNAESIDTVTIASAGGLDASTTANAGTHADDLVISGQSGSNGFNADNYTFTYVDGDLLVNRRAITLAALTQNKDYGDSLTLDDAAFSVTDLDGDALLPNAERISAVSLASLTGTDGSSTVDAGTYVDEIRITGQSGADGFAAANYDITYVDGDLVVDRRAITVTATQQNKIYGDVLSLDNTAFTVLDRDGTGLLPNGEQIDTVTLGSQTGIDASTTTNAGTYTDEIRITGQSGADGFAAANYDVTYVDGNLVVDRRAVTLTALQQEKIYGNSLTLDNTAFAVLDKDGDATLPNAESIDTVTIASASGLDASTSASAGTHADDLVISGQSGSNGFGAGNYTFTYVDGDLLVNRRAITLAALTQNKDYGDTLTLDGAAFTITDLDGGGSLPNGEQVDTVTLNSQTGVDASTDANVGTYTDAIAITDQSGSGGFDASNYDITYTDGDLVVDPRAITVTATQQNKAYGDELSLDNAAFTVLDRDGTGLLPNDELIDTVTLGSQTGIDASTTANAGTYSDEIQATAVAGSAGFDDGNYTITFVDGDLVVDRRAVTLTALQQEKIYGNTLTLDNTAFAVLDKDGGATLPNAESIDTVTIASAGGLDASTTASAGTHSDDLVISGQSGSNGFDAGNYTFTYVDGDLLVNRRAITLTASAQNKDYGDTLTLDNAAFSVTDLDGDALLPNAERISAVSLASLTGTDGSSTVDAGTYVDEIRITDQSGADGFAAANYDITYVDGDLVVDRRAVTLTALQQEKIYGNTLNLDGTAFTVLDKDGNNVLPNGETIDLVSLNSATGIDGNTQSGVDTYGDEIQIVGQNGSGGFDAANYTFTYVDGDLIIHPRAITLTALDQERIFYDPVTPDPRAFAVIDADGDASLPNDERIDTAIVTSVGGVATDLTAKPGLYADNLVITGQAGSNGFDADNYQITYLPGNLAITGMDAPPVTLVEAIGESASYLTGSNVSGTDAFAFAVPLLSLFGYPEWGALTGSQREWLWRQFDRTPAEEVTAIFLQQLLNQALIQ